MYIHKYVLFAENRAGLPCCWYSLLSIGNAQNALPGILGFPCGQLPSKEREKATASRRAAIYRSRDNWLFISQTNKHAHTHINFSLSLWQKREQRASNLHSPTAPSISYKATLLMSHYYYYYYTPPPPHALTYFRTSVHSWAAFVDWMPIGACIKYTFSMLCTYFSAHTTLQNLHKKCMNAVCVCVCVCIFLKPFRVCTHTR